MITLFIIYPHFSLLQSSDSPGSSLWSSPTLIQRSVQSMMQGEEGWKRDLEDQIENVHQEGLLDTEVLA